MSIILACNCVLKFQPNLDNDTGPHGALEIDNRPGVEVLEWFLTTVYNYDTLLPISW